MKTAADYSLDEALERAFERKRVNFIADYELGERPALVWQCMPAEPLVVDVANEPLREVLRDGAAAISDTGWWYAFKSGRRPTFVFEGLASSAVADATGCATEVHADGHVLAGLWTFPEVSSNTQTPSPAVAEFYTEAFRDFGFVAGKVYEATVYTRSALVTCTMLRSNQLPLAGSRDRILTPAVNRGELRWPIMTVEGPGHVSTACEAMAAQFMRAYGRVAPKS
jgi:hypothetical protein